MTEPDLLAIARQLIPAEGNDFGSVARGGEAERAFRARVEPFVHPAFEAIWPGTDEHATGLESTMTALHRVGQMFDSLVAIPERYVPLEDDRVLVLLHRDGRTFNGYEFAEEGAVIYDFEEGLLRRMLLYAHRPPALEDAGLTAEEAERRGLPPEPADA